MKTQRRLAADILNTSKKHIRFEPSRLEEIEEAITRADVKRLIREGAITEKHNDHQSRSKARHTKSQKSKGRQKGPGTKKGGQKARSPRKRNWINKIRSQRTLLKTLKDNEKISAQTYRELYRKAKGGYFRSKRHIKLYIDQNELIEEQ